MSYFSSEKLDEYTTRILCPGRVYAYLVEGFRRALLIDTGMGLYSLKEFVNLLADKPMDVVLTHGHVDHAGGAGEFEKVYMNVRDLQVAREHTTIETRDMFLTMTGTEHNIKDMIAQKLEGYLPLENGAVFELGGVNVSAFAMYGHTPGSMIMVIDRTRTALFGDACCSFTLLDFDHSVSVHEYLECLRVIKENVEDKYDKVIYSHPHNFGGKEVLDEAIECCEDILNGAQPVTLEDGRKAAKYVGAGDRRVDGKIFNCSWNPDKL